MEFKMSEENKKSAKRRNDVLDLQIEIGKMLGNNFMILSGILGKFELSVDMKAIENIGKKKDLSAVINVIEQAEKMFNDITNE